MYNSGLHVWRLLTLRLLGFWAMYNNGFPRRMGFHNIRLTFTCASRFTISISNHNITCINRSPPRHVYYVAPLEQSHFSIVHF
jgi:hypothetical protein